MEVFIDDNNDMVYIIDLGKIASSPMKLHFPFRSLDRETERNITSGE